MNERMNERLAETLKIVRLYREREVLWNMHCRSYRSNVLKQKALEEIANKCNMTVVQVKKKLKSLRSTYIAEKRKVEQHKKSSLTWYDEMSFLNSCILFRRPIDKARSKAVDRYIKVISPNMDNSEPADENEMTSNVLKAAEKNITTPDETQDPVGNITIHDETTATDGYITHSDEIADGYSSHDNDSVEWLLKDESVNKCSNLDNYSAKTVEPVVNDPLAFVAKQRRLNNEATASSNITSTSKSVFGLEKNQLKHAHDHGDKADDGNDLKNPNQLHEFDVFCNSLAIQLKKMPLRYALICQEKLQNVMTEHRLLLLPEVDGRSSLSNGWEKSNVSENYFSSPSSCTN